MATKKAASTKKPAAKRPAAAKTTVRTVSAATKKTASKQTASSKVRQILSGRTGSAATSASTGKLLPDNFINVMLAELFGSFILTTVLLATVVDTFKLSSIGDSFNLYVGLTMALIVMAVGAVSGAHVNPAVTFGLWAVGKVKSAMVPIYWIAQVIGAIFAIVILSWVASVDLDLSFGNFMSWDWSVVGIELVGTAVLLFGWMAVISKKDLSSGSKAIGIGLSMMVALVVAGTIYTSARTQAIDVFQKQSAEQQAATSEDGDETEATEPEIPRIVHVKYPALNPAASIVITESTDSQLKTGVKDASEKTYSHLTIEVIVATLVGAALGSHLYLLVAGRKARD